MTGHAPDRRRRAASPDVEGSTGSSNETYGFLGWITSSVLYCMFIAWACTPDALLHFHGVTWYPDKYWACAIPVWAGVTLVTAFFLYGVLNDAYGERLVAKKRAELLERDMGHAEARRGRTVPRNGLPERPRG